MIDPKKITDFKRTQSELEELLLFCILAAGKTASVQARKLESFLNKSELTPFELIKFYIQKGILLEKIQEEKLGQYSRLMKAFAQVVKLDVFNCTVQDLEGITGIGPKTARFYILHSRPNQKVAVLDTHVLKWLREEMGLDAPRSTPSSKQYLALEKEFLSYCRTHKKNPAIFDLEIWNRYSKR